MREPTTSKAPRAIAARGAVVAAGLLIVALTIYALFLLSRFAPAIATPDGNGYFAQGSLLATTGRTWFRTEADCQFVGVHWLATPDDRYVSRYPPGLAVAVALVFRTLGWRVSLLINPLLAVLTLLGLYFALRRLAGPWWALAGVVLLAVNPVFSVQALSDDAHVAVTFLLMWGLVFLLRWSDAGRIVDAFAAGLFFGAVPAVRYPEALFGVAAVVFLAWRGFEARKEFGRPTWRAWLAAAVGAAGPIAALLVHNQLVFGAFWRTGYAITHEQTAFGLDYLGRHFISYIRQIQGDGLGVLFALGVVGMVMMGFDRRRRALAVTLALVALPTMVLYMAYYWATATQRFLLPTYPCYLIAGVWLLNYLTRDRSRALQVSLVAVVIALQVAQGGVYGFAWTRHLHYQKDVLARATGAVESVTSPGDVILSNPQVLQQLDFVRRWKLVDLPTRLMGSPSDASQDTGAPRLIQSEKRRRLAERLAGMTHRERERDAAQEIRAWAGNGKVYFVGTERELAQMPPPYFGAEAFRVVARVSLPEAPELPQAEGTGGGASRRVTAEAPVVEREVVIAEWIVPAPTSP